MRVRDPINNFEIFWATFNERYPFFALRGVDWQRQHKIFRPHVTDTTSEEELFEIFCAMIDPLDDGHVELEGRVGNGRQKRHYTAEKPARFHREFTKKQIKQLFSITESTLAKNSFGRIQDTKAWMLRYGRSASIGYLRVLELENVKQKKVAAALKKITRDFDKLEGFIIDVRNNPGGEDSTALAIINRFCDQRRVAFRRRTKIGPSDKDYTPLKTWHIEPEGEVQFTKPIVLLTCDAVFSGGECFTLAMRELPHVTILGDRTNGIFSYQLERTLPNGWNYCLSYQEYLSADMVCYEAKGVPCDIKLMNTKADLESGVDPLVFRALELLSYIPPSTA